MGQELTVKELARHYGVHEMSVRRWMVSGLPTNPPKETTIDVAEADRWIQENGKMTVNSRRGLAKAESAA